MMNTKNLSNPRSTGGAGHSFESRVQASFVTLMLTGGYAPCLPCWPIEKIQLQARIDDFNTDDIVVFVKNAGNNERRKLLGQIKCSIDITEGNAAFGEVVQAAWSDFNNPDVFNKGEDIIALITGPLSKTDATNVLWLLEQARHTNDVGEFFRRVHLAKFGPAKRKDKLKAIQHHLKKANGGNDVTDHELYAFLRHFHVLSCDLGNECGFVLSLLHSRISQFQQQFPVWLWLWSRIVNIVQEENKNAGTITPDNLPEELLEAFKPKAIEQMPKELKGAKEKSKTDWVQHPDATFLALAILIGSWNDKNEKDLETITNWLGISYDEWLEKAREILHCPDSPLSLKNGVWKVGNRTGLWELLGSRIFDRDLDKFKSLAVSVLREPDPAFELPVEERYAASIHGKVLKYSHVLRKGIAEGLAILGNQPDACSNCSQGEVEETCVLVICELLTDADWVLWGSLNDLLPALSEAAPGEFLGAVENKMRLTPGPFDELFSQESYDRNYLTGLFRALEGLAWDEQYLVRVCVALAELASHDPGGRFANRPSNSLVTILLPWLPQTLASIDKRKVAVEAVLREQPDIGWNLLIQLLPNQQQTSSRSHKPSWRKIIPDNLEEKVTNQEYWQQSSFYAELAVTAAGQDTARLSALIDHFDKLPEPAFDRLLQSLVSEEQRLPIWQHLTKFTSKHRRYSDAKWALSDEQITRIEQVAKNLAPTNLFNLYQYLFTDSDFDLYERNGNWQEQERKLDARRENAISEIFQQDGAEGIIRFAESVSSSAKVGYALGVIIDASIEQTLLPHFLDTTDNKRKALVRSFIWRRNDVSGWEWCDNIDKSDWTPAQIGQFLGCLPFIREAWDRAAEWLQAHESEYWTCAEANAYQKDSDINIAIEKLIEHGRPYAALNCLGHMHYTNQPIDTNQCVQALLAEPSSDPDYPPNTNHIVKLIKLVQTDPSVKQDDLFQVEWIYVSLLHSHRDATPRFLENRLANDPEFFCEVIRRLYRSRREDQPSQGPTEELRAVAERAWQLLHGWKTPPGTQEDGSFNEEHFTEWLQSVKTSCAKSGHLEVALIYIGGVLIHTPPDSDGLWIHRAVATTLNDRDADDMRNGFRTGMRNLRGVYWVDPTGKPEGELAEQFRSKAEKVENAGFQRFAVTLRNLADDYDQEAQRNIAEYEKDIDG